MTMEMTKRLALCMIAAATAACATMRANGDLQTLSGPDWRLVELNGRAAAPAADPARRPWVRFHTDSSRVSGSGGCNRMGGTFTVSGESMHFGPLISTKMACADQALNQQEFDFFGALQSTDRYVVSGDTLKLMKGAETVARFRP